MDFGSGSQWNRAAGGKRFDAREKRSFFLLFFFLSIGIPVSSGSGVICVYLVIVVKSSVWFLAHYIIQIYTGLFFIISRIL